MDAVTHRRLPGRVDSRSQTPSSDRTANAVWHTEAMSASDLPKIGAPAARALASIGVTRLDQLVDRRRSQLLALHGVGPRAVRTLEEALAARGLALRP